ncbi:MAG: hypothetical protein QOG95_1371, partial [Mycobacterium sp.]|nr:hypothetical protein [Mycobacterium sp.]
GQFGDANLDVVTRLCRCAQIVGVPALLAPFHHHSLWATTTGTMLASGPNTIIPTVPRSLLPPAHVHHVLFPHDFVYNLQLTALLLTTAF